MEVLTELKSGINLAILKLSKIHVNKNKLDLVILLLYLRILDYANAMERMVPLGLSPGIYQLVVRSILEASSKQELLINEPKWFSAIEFSELKSEIDMLHSFKLEKSSLFNSPEGNSYLNGLKARYRELEKRKFEHLRPNDIFKRIGAKDLHESVYKHLCQSTHSSISALFAEYAEINPEKEEFSVVPFPASEEKELFPHIHTCGLTMISASIRTHKYFNSEVKEDFTPLYQLFRGLRSENSIE